MGVARTRGSSLRRSAGRRGSSLRRSAGRRGSTGHQTPPQILSTEVVEQDGKTWHSPANAGNALGKQVSGGGSLDTAPQDDATDA
ncbi:hypothetical protein ACFVYE_33340 [Streptomyces sp. NPDC058239]|uniref:hypothetical protein n=1 Tax=unclassified Streptomyces TaxID=2593676 RepID=UPI003659F045